MKICRVSLTEKSRLQPHDITNQPSVMHNRGSISPKLPCARKRDRTFDRLSHEHTGFYCSNSYMHKRETQYFYSLFIDSWFLLLRFLCPSCTRLGVLNAVTMLYQRLYYSQTSIAHGSAQIMSVSLPPLSDPVIKLLPANAVPDQVHCHAKTFHIPIPCLVIKEKHIFESQSS
jgi:hypothetical protein